MTKMNLPMKPNEEELREISKTAFLR
jgi:hypothetical protein